MLLTSTLPDVFNCEAGAPGEGIREAFLNGSLAILGASLRVHPMPSVPHLRRDQGSDRKPCGIRLAMWTS
jgi:hypothetical protein